MIDGEADAFDRFDAAFIGFFKPFEYQSMGNICHICTDPYTLESNKMVLKNTITMMGCRTKAKN
ncbi:hypothetical protein TUM4637_34820 [Shewanella hafniensis]|nr:hypothetical protein TUM4637_34820 [Shewanella hafniensis]